MFSLKIHSTSKLPAQRLFFHNKIVGIFYSKSKCDLLISNQKIYKTIHKYLLNTKRRKTFSQTLFLCPLMFSKLRTSSIWWGLGPYCLYFCTLYFYQTEGLCRTHVIVDSGHIMLQLANVVFVKHRTTFHFMPPLIPIMLAPPFSAGQVRLCSLSLS